jgi:hypothetical protein
MIVAFLDPDPADQNQCGSAGSTTLVNFLGHFKVWLYSVDVAAFLSLAKVGDRLEFQREGYCHWAIYVGEQYIPIDDKVFVAPLLEKSVLRIRIRDPVPF